MNFNQSVDREVIDTILESALWTKAGIKLAQRVDESAGTPNEGEIGTIPEYEEGIGNGYDEEDISYIEDSDVGFSLEDLQTVLDNLEEDDLMEHALNMLEVFDVAYETIEEGLLEYDEYEDEDTLEEEEEDY